MICVYVHKLIGSISNLSQHPQLTNKADITHLHPFGCLSICMGKMRLQTTGFGRALFFGKSNCRFYIPIYPDDTDLHPFISSYIHCGESSSRIFRTIEP